VFTCLLSDNSETECIYGSEWFVSFLVFFLIGTVVYFVYKDNEKSKKRRGGMQY